MILARSHRHCLLKWQLSLESLHARICWTNLILQFFPCSVNVCALMFTSVDKSKHYFPQALANTLKISCFTLRSGIPPLRPPCMVLIWGGWESVGTVLCFSPIQGSPGWDETTNYHCWCLKRFKITSTVHHYTSIFISIIITVYLKSNCLNILRTVSVRVQDRLTGSFGVSFHRDTTSWRNHDGARFP